MWMSSSFKIGPKIIVCLLFWIILNPWFCGDQMIQVYICIPLLKKAPKHGRKLAKESSSILSICPSMSQLVSFYLKCDIVIWDVTCSFVCREGYGFDSSFVVWVLFLQLPEVLYWKGHSDMSACDKSEGRWDSRFQECHGDHWVQHPGPHQGTSPHVTSRKAVAL